MKMMKMRIKKDFMLCFLLVIAVMYFVLVAPTFADMKEVDEAELSRTKASVTGTPIKNFNCVEKDGVCQKTEDRVTSDKIAAVSSPDVKSIITEVIDLNQNINGQTTFQFHFGGATSTATGGIIEVKPLR